MQRIALILALFILLMNGRHPGLAPVAPDGPLAVEAHALPLEGAAVNAFGPLRLTGAWHLTSPQEAFGGLSALIEQGGRLTGLSDSGELFELAAPIGGGESAIRSLPRFAHEQDFPRWRMDSESLTHDPATGRLWVGFEHLQRICRYAPGFAALESCAAPPEMQDWPVTGGIESLVRLGDGRFLAIAEMAVDRTGAHEVLLWQGDPVARETPPPMRLGYRPPPGHRPTDALWLGGDRLLVLDRRLTLAHGFTARLSLVRLPPLREGAVLTGHEVARFEPSGLADNFEALALSETQGRPQLWVASDDNRFAFQRTLLLRFDLPADWVSDAPAP